MDIITRAGTSQDLKAVAQFWSEHSGWGEMDESSWVQTFGRTPQGPSELILAEIKETGEMIGQFIFLPVPVAIDGREVLAYRPFAPIVKSDLRLQDDSFSLQGVMLQMYLFAVEHLTQLGTELLYVLPDPRWARLFSFAPFFSLGSFPLMSIALSALSDRPTLPGFKVEAMDFSDARIDELWAQTKNQYGCLALRNQTFLQWKNSHRAYQLWAVQDEKGGILGSFVSIRKIQQKQCLICDVLCTQEPGAFYTIVQAALAHLNEQERALPEGEPVMDKIGLLAIPAMVPELEVLGFQKDKYNFHLVVHALNPDLSQGLIAPERWYLSAND